MLRRSYRNELNAGPNGADVYAFYFLPGNADVLRTDENPPRCETE
jgi:hypothetical protein